MWEEEQVRGDGWRVVAVEEKLDHVAATLTTLVTQLGRQSPPPLGGGATYSA